MNWPFPGMREFFLGVPVSATGALNEGKKEPEAKIVKSQFIREMPLNVTFERLIQYHDQTPEVRVAVTGYRELITGTDMTVSSDNDDATELINEWIRKTDFYAKFENLVTTILICGNGLLEKLSESDTEDVEEVDMSTILAKKRTDTGELEYYEQRQQQGKIERLAEKNKERFIEFNLTSYSKQAWGRSLFYPLAVPRTTGGRTMPPLVEVLWATQDAVGAILMNDAYPIKTVTYPGANDDMLQKETEKWRRYKPGDARIQKIKPDIEFFESQHSAGRYQPHIDFLAKTIELGTQFPHDILTGDFTSRASSETTQNIVLKIARGFGKYLCQKLVDDLFEPILEQNGFNNDEVNLEISFVTQNIIDLEVQQVKDLVAAGLMTDNEGREWLRLNTGMELPDDAQLQQDKQLQQEQDNAMQGKVKDLESKIKQITFEKNAGDKMMQIQEKIEKKMTAVKEAAEEDNKRLFSSRKKVLEKLMREAERLG